MTERVAAIAKERALAPLGLLTVSAWNLALAGFSALIVGSIALLQIAHVGDKYLVDPASGVWMGLAKETASGLFYPPLFDGTHFGGTRYMPVPIVFPAALYKVTGDLVVSEKVMLYLFALLTFGLVYAILRRRGCPRLVALLFVSGALATWTGVLAAAAIRWDTPALLFQLAALAVVDRRRDPKALVLAGFLCSLGLASKTSALWGPIAIAIWLAVYERRRIGIFLAGFAGSALAVLGACELASHGRLSSNVLALLLAAYHHQLGVGEYPAGFRTARFFLSHDLPHEARVGLLLVPFVVLAYVRAAARRRVSVYDLALPVAGVILFFSYFDPGVSFNHLIDVVVLAVVVVGALWGDLRAGPSRLTWLGAVAAVAGFLDAWLDLFGWALVAELLAMTAFLLCCLWWTRRSGSSDSTWLAAAATLVVVVAGGQFFHLGVFLPEVKFAAKSLLGHGDDRYTTHPLAGYVSASDSILSEDPSIPVLLGQRAVILDPFSFDRLVRTRPRLAADLARRVAAKRFDKLVLQAPIEEEGAHLGVAVDAQIPLSYRLAEKVVTRASGVYWVYVPK